MKAKTFLFAVLAATMTLASCDKSENEMGGSNTGQQPKSVTIKLANVQAPQSKTRGSQAPVQDNDAAKLNSFTIFFVDAAGKFYEGYAASDTEKKTKLKRTYTANETVPTFHYLDASVTKVIVVGNPKWTTEPANEAALKTQTKVNIADEQDVDNLVLFGEAGLAKKNPAADEAGHTETYVANVNVLPLVARLEIGSFEYEQVDDATTRNYTSLTLNHMAVNTYMGTCQYGGTTEGLVNASISSSTVWSYLEGLTTGWYNDKGMNITLNADNTYKYAVDFTAENAQVFAYNVFAGTVPQVVLGMSGTKADGNTAALYLVTKGLGTNGEFKAGYVYRMNATSPFVFNDEDLGNPDKCVEVTVTPKEWTVIAVSPEF